MTAILLILIPALPVLLGRSGPLAGPAELVLWASLGLEVYAMGGYVRLRRRALIPSAPLIVPLAVLAVPQGVLAALGAAHWALALAGPALDMVRRLSRPVLDPALHQRVWRGVLLALAVAVAWNLWAGWR